MPPFVSVKLPRAEAEFRSEFEVLLVDLFESTLPVDLEVLDRNLKGETLNQSGLRLTDGMTGVKDRLTITDEETGERLILSDGEKSPRCESRFIEDLNEDRT